ncbi:hypothetical protein GT755_35525 [Herbidospora sp. NEAU-GS84]|uniref:NurA domain-containing protein n=1 Tax=Herbidospora solisilvae TaxID=2696284 RepID=A0A7C9JCF0_9ACTN|nr:hypothetical protein [Herbidospora solisilvae]NAS26968.1 hypothetical protein [Herbidospora solisilvae]
MTTTYHAPGFSVDPWDPGYGASLAFEAEMEGSSAALTLDVEIPVLQWRPITPGATTRAPETLLIADGVRRIDARVWVDDPEGGMPAPGIAASYAAGIVRCGEGAEPVAVEVRRGVFTPAKGVADLVAGPVTYTSHEVTGDDDGSLALQQKLTELEVDLALGYRAQTGHDELLVVDGPLRGRTHLANAVGYVKTHHTSYLPPAQSAVVSDLKPGQRTPVFFMGTNWSRYAWYLRLPTISTAPWAGIARCEAGADLSAEDAVELADRVTVALPPMAGVDYKDPRAPQNLVPIGGLEKLLRHRLGDARLLYRALRTAAVAG